MAVTAKISVVNAKITEFGDLTNKTDDDTTAISHLNTVMDHLSDVSGLLTVRSVDAESKKHKFLVLVTKKILIGCNKWSNLKAKFVAIQSIVSAIKALTNLNTAILSYVTDELEPFVTSHMTKIDNEIR